MAVEQCISPAMDSVVMLLRAKWMAKEKRPHTSPDVMAISRPNCGSTSPMTTLMRKTAQIAAKLSRWNFLRESHRFSTRKPTALKTSRPESMKRGR